MNLEPAPRLSKTTFFLIDAGLLLTAFIIVYFNSKNPYAPLPFISAVICVILAAIIGLIPYLIEYAADSAEYVQKERLRVNEQIQRLQTGAESLARAAAQIKAVEEAVHKAAHSAENLPYRMQEKLAEFNEALAEKESADREALEEELNELRAANSNQLKAVAEKIAKATTELTALEASTRRHLTTAEAAATKIQQGIINAADELETKLNRAVAALDAKLLSIAIPPTLAPTAPITVFRATEEEPTPVTEALQPLAQPEKKNAISLVADILNFDEPALSLTSEDEAKAKKPRAPRKPKPEEIPAATTPAESAPAPAADDEPTDENGSEPELIATTAEEPTEAAASSDGATRLLATAYIGIGNKLYIRGDGPGLSWDKGTPMQFVSIGKWGWATHEASAPVRCALYKNDDTAALTGEVTLEPGKHIEITALF